MKEEFFVPEDFSQEMLKRLNGILLIDENKKRNIVVTVKGIERVGMSYTGLWIAERSHLVWEALKPRQ